MQSITSFAATLTLIAVVGLVATATTPADPPVAAQGTNPSSAGSLVAGDAATAIAVEMCSGPSFCGGAPSFDVPVGQRLVVEQVSGWCTLGGGIQLQVRLNGQSFVHFIPSNAVVFHTLTRFYADEVVELMPQGGTRGCGITLSGYLVATRP